MAILAYFGEQASMTWFLPGRVSGSGRAERQLDLWTQDAVQGIAGSIDHRGMRTLIRIAMDAHGVDDGLGHRGGIAIAEHAAVNPGVAHMLVRRVLRGCIHGIHHLLHAACSADRALCPATLRPDRTRTWRVAQLP